MNAQAFSVTLDGKAIDVAAASRIASRDLLFFLHGLGCSKETFRGVWQREDYQDLSLLAVDLAGFGASARPEGFSYTMEDQARLCEAILNMFPGFRLHIIAHSMGGAVGLLLSKSVLESARSFVNVEGNLVEADCACLSRKIIDLSYEEFEGRWFPAFKSRFEDDKELHEPLEMSFPLGFYRSSKSLVAWSDSGKLLERFKGLACRKAYFYGERNAGMAVLDVLAGVDKVRISNSGHFPMNDNPDEFYEELLKLLIPTR